MPSPHATRPRRWWRRVPGPIQRPWVSLLLLALVLLDMFTLAPGYEYAQGGSRVANAIGSLLPPELRQAEPPSRSPHGYFAWYGDTDELLPSSRSEREKRQWTIFFDVYSSFSAGYSGWWGLTSEDRGFSWIYDSAGQPGGPAAPANLGQRVNQAFVDAIRASGDGFWIAEADRATRLPGMFGYTEKRVRWQGWARNAATVSLLLLLALSLGWVWRDARERRRWRQLARRRCPDCGYELGSIPNEAACPECGNPHPPRTGVKPPGLAARAWRRVRTPLGTLVLAGVMMLDVLLLPKGEKGRGSWVANHLPTPAIRTERGDGRPIDKLLLGVMLKDGALDFHAMGPAWPNTKNGGALAWGSDDVFEMADGTVRTMKEIVVVVTIARDSYSQGFWAPVRCYTNCSYGGWGWEGLQVDLRDGFDERMRSWLESARMPHWAADLRLRKGRDGYHFSTIWTGHIHNALAMGAGLALVCSLAWIPARAARQGAPAPGKGGRCGCCLAPRDGDDPCGVCGEPGPGERRGERRSGGWNRTQGEPGM